MRFTIARGAAFKAAVFGSSLMLLGGAGYATAQQGTAAHAPSRASATPPPVTKHHHPKPKPKKQHGNTKGHAKQHGKPVHHAAPHKTKAANHQKRAPRR